DPPRRAVARPLPRVVILHAAVHVVGIVHVHADRVNLADAHVGEVVTGLATVHRDADTTIGAEDDAVLVLRVPPHGAEVTEHAPEELAVPGLAAVARDEHRIAGDDHRLVVVRIDAHLVERV